MKKLISLFLVLLLAQAAIAQVGSACPGLKNPANFTSGSTSGQFVGYYSGETGTKINQAPNAMTGATGVSLDGTIIPANQLASTTDNGGSSYCGASLNPSNRFRIMSNTDGPGSGSQVGKDPLVSYNLPYCPTPFDPTFTRSIRLGNCQTGAKAEALYYTMNVRLQNALTFIYYSIVVQAPGHGISQDPAFVIRVCKKNSANQWVQISDTLCYAVSSNGLVNGQNAWHSYSGSGGNGYYRDWNKVAINLNKYIYEQVRIEIFMGDCSQSGHYGYCYVAGDCQPMEIRSSGCPAGSSNVIDTLRAPTGLSEYTWTRAAIDGQYISSLNSVDPTINFVPVEGTPEENVYGCVAEDFRIIEDIEGGREGELTNNMVFRCEMTSAMDPAKPFTSRLYARVINTKPLMSIDTVKDCDGCVKIINKSYVPSMPNGVDTSTSYWWFYAESDTLSPILDSITQFGPNVHNGQATFCWDEPGIYAVKVRSFNTLDRTCFTDSTYTIKALGRPHAGFEIYPGRDVCAAERVILTDTTSSGTRRDWIFYDFQDGDVIGSDTVLRCTSDTISRVFENYRNPIEMVAYNGLYTLDELVLTDTTWCTSSAFDTVEVFQHPELEVSGDTVVCNGQQTDIYVSTETENCRYRWYLDTLGNGYISEGQTLNTMPYGDTCRYYVKVISPMQCEAWDSVNAYRVNPTLSISRHDMCDGDAVTLTADKAYSFSWTATPADSSLDMLLDSAGHGPRTITVTPHQTTVYTMVGHGTNDCNAAPLTEQITVHPVPTATIEAYPGFVDSDNPVVTFTDASPHSVRRVWYFDDGQSEDYLSPCSHNFGEVSSDSTAVTLVAYNDLDCSDTMILKLPVTQFTFYAPNAFTPERPDNNTFRIYTANPQENFSIYIYDRMGRQVYTSQDLHFAWDGTYESKKLPQGTYTYVIRYRRPGTEDIVTQKGTVTLIR